MSKNKVIKPKADDGPSPLDKKEGNSVLNLVLNIADFSNNTEVLDFLIKIIVPEEFWTPDHYELFCKSCLKTFFVFFRRKHHCRGCGHLFCKKCSEDSLEIKNIEILESRFHKMSLMAQNSKRFEKKMRLCGKCFNRISSDLVAVVNGTMQKNQEIVTRVEMPLGKKNKINSVLTLKKPAASSEKSESPENSHSRQSDIQEKFIAAQLGAKQNVGISKWFFPSQVSMSWSSFESCNYFGNLAQKFRSKQKMSEEDFLEDPETPNKANGVFWSIYFTKIQSEFLDFGFSSAFFQEFNGGIEKYLEFIKKAGRRIIKNSHSTRVFGFLNQKHQIDNPPFLIKCIANGVDGNSNFCSMFKGSLVQNQQLVNARRSLKKTNHVSVVFLEGSMDIQAMVLGFKERNTGKRQASSGVPVGSVGSKGSFFSKGNELASFKGEATRKQSLLSALSIPGRRESPLRTMRHESIAKNNRLSEQNEQFRKTIQKTQRKSKVKSLATSFFSKFSFGSKAKKQQANLNQSFSIETKKKGTNQAEEKESKYLHMKHYIRFEQIAEKELNLMTSLAKRLLEFEANVLVFRDYIPRLLQETLRKRGIVIISNLNSKDFSRLCQYFAVSPVESLDSLKFCLENRLNFVGKCGSLTVEPSPPLPYSQVPNGIQEEAFNISMASVNLGSSQGISQEELRRKEESGISDTSQSEEEKLKAKKRPSLKPKNDQENMDQASGATKEAIEEKIKKLGELPNQRMEGFGFFEKFNKENNVPWQIILTGENHEELKKIKKAFRTVLLQSLHLSYEQPLCFYDLKHACSIEKIHGNMIKMSQEEMNHVHKNFRKKIDELPREISLIHTGDFTISLAVRMGFHAFHRLNSIKLVKVSLVPMRRTTIFKDMSVDIFLKVSGLLESIKKISDYIHNIGSIDYEEQFKEMASIFTKRRRDSYDLLDEIDFRDAGSRLTSHFDEKSPDGNQNRLISLANFKESQKTSIFESLKSKNGDYSILGVKDSRRATVSRKPTGFASKKEESSNTKTIFQNIAAFHQTIENPYNFLNNMPFFLGNSYNSILSSFNISKSFNLMHKCKDVCTETLELYGKGDITLRHYLEHKREASTRECTCGNCLDDHLAVYYMNNRAIIIRFETEEFVLMEESRKESIKGSFKGSIIAKGTRKGSNEEGDGAGRKRIILRRSSVSVLSTPKNQNDNFGEYSRRKASENIREKENKSESFEQKLKNAQNKPRRSSAKIKENPSLTPQPYSHDIQKNKKQLKAHFFNEDSPESQAHDHTLNRALTLYTPIINSTRNNQRTPRFSDISPAHQDFRKLAEEINKRNPKETTQIHFECVHCQKELTSPELLPEKTLNMSFALFLFETGYSTAGFHQSYFDDIKGRFSSDSGQCFHRVATRVFTFRNLRMHIQVQPTCLFKFILPSFHSLLRASSRRDRCQEFAHCDYQLFLKSAHISIQFLHDSLVSLAYFTTILHRITSIKTIKEFSGFLSKRDESLKSSVADIYNSNSSNASLSEMRLKIQVLLEEITKLLEDQTQEEASIQRNSPTAYFRSKYFNDFLWVGSNRMKFYENLSKVMDQINGLFTAFVSIALTGSGQKIVGKVTSKILNDQLFFGGSGGDSRNEYTPEQLKILLSFKHVLKIIIRFQQFTCLPENPPTDFETSLFASENLGRSRRSERPSYFGGGDQISPRGNSPEWMGSKPQEIGGIHVKKQTSFLTEEEISIGGKSRENEIKMGGAQSYVEKNTKGSFMSALKSIGTGYHLVQEQPESKNEGMSYVRLLIGIQ